MMHNLSDDVHRAHKHPAPLHPPTRFLLRHFADVPRGYMPSPYEHPAGSPQMMSVQFPLDGLCCQTFKKLPLFRFILKKRSAYTKFKIITPETNAKMETIFCLFTDSPNKNMPRSAVRMMVSADHTAYTIPISKYLIADEMKKFVKMKRINAVRVGSNTLKPFDIFTHIWANIANMIPKLKDAYPIIRLPPDLFV